MYRNFVCRFRTYSDKSLIKHINAICVNAYAIPTMNNAFNSLRLEHAFDSHTSLVCDSACPYSYTLNTKCATRFLINPDVQEKLYLVNSLVIWGIGTRGLMME